MGAISDFINHILAGGEGVLLSVKNDVVGHQLYLGWGKKSVADFDAGPFPLFSTIDWKGEHAHHWHFSNFFELQVPLEQGELTQTREDALGDKEAFRGISALEQIHTNLDLSDLASYATETKASFVDKVQQVQARQRAGEAWVTNLTHELSGLVPEGLEAHQLALKVFYEYLKLGHNHCGGVVITKEQIFCSLSPETFLLQSGSALQAFPIKGTGSEAELEQSGKEISELHMITDLLRNDLGQICDSVHVARERYLTPEHGFYHARAEIVGTLPLSPLVEKKSPDAPNVAPPPLTRGLLWDDYKKLLPAGSISGAPKTRVFKILAELESFDRGYYTGTFGLKLSPQKSLYNILIRTLFINPSPRTWSFPVGAGITIESDPVAEWEETLQKAEILKKLTI